MTRDNFFFLLDFGCCSCLCACEKNWTRPQTELNYTGKYKNKNILRTNQYGQMVVYVYFAIFIPMSYTYMHQFTEMWITLVGVRVNVHTFEVQEKHCERPAIRYLGAKMFDTNEPINFQHIHPNVSLAVTRSQIATTLNWRRRKIKLINCWNGFASETVLIISFLAEASVGNKNNNVRHHHIFATNHLRKFFTSLSNP